MISSTMMLYGTALSGHTHRVELLLRALDLPYAFTAAPADMRRSASFRALTPIGQIPVLVDGDLVLPDSNAILVHLARTYDKSGEWLPQDTARAVQIQRWLSVAAGDIRFGPALARLIVRFGARGDLAEAQAVGKTLFAAMDQHLARSPYLVGGTATIADLACYSYIAIAPEGGLDLEPFGALQSWLARVEALPRFKPMQR